MPHDMAPSGPVPLSQAHRRLTAASEFRLMILLPSPDFESTIACRLEHAQLGSCKPYEALSYVWGEPIFDKHILLDDQDFMITGNLESALRHLRLPEEERTLWVDAICINQRDLAERREQVGYMREIYSNCASDVVWLAAHNEEYSRGMDIIRKLEGYQLDQIESLGWKSSKAAHRALSEAVRLEDETGGGDRPEHNLPIPPKVWVLSYDDNRALVKLLNMDAIWRRVWIKQEIACAPKVFLMCGKETLDWSLVEAILQGGRYFTDAFHLPFGHGWATWQQLFDEAQLITNQRDALRKGEETSLLDVLARFRQAVSTDPRDKIYGLLGLVSNTLGVEADYTKSVQELYIAVTTSLINSSANIDIICQNPWQRPATSREKRLDGLPDWVPDFSDSSRMNVDFLYGQRGIFAPGRPTCAVPCIVEEPGVISLNGFLLGRLNTSKGFADGYIDRDRMRDLLRDWFEQNLTTQIPVKAAPHQYRTGEDRLQAFWRTVTGDCKGYPTERLTPEDIAHDQDIVQEIVANKETTKDPGELRCCEIVRKLVAQGWRFHTSNNGLFVLAQSGTMEGDVVAILDGAKTPMVLRPVEDDPKEDALYLPIGGAYVHGFMDGEVLNCGDEFQEQVFRVA